MPCPPQLYHTTEHQDEPTAALDDPPILVSAAKPTAEQRIEALNAALAAARARERRDKEAQQAERREKRGW